MHTYERVLLKCLPYSVKVSTKGAGGQIYPKFCLRVLNTPSYWAYFGHLWLLIERVPFVLLTFSHSAQCRVVDSHTCTSRDLWKTLARRYLWQAGKKQHLWQLSLHERRSLESYIFGGFLSLSKRRSLAASQPLFCKEKRSNIISDKTKFLISRKKIFRWNFFYIQRKT